MELEFRICNICGNIVGIVNDSGAPLTCCNEKMSIIKANTVDATKEKHIPVIKKDGNTITVCVGSSAHPMTADHYIQWIAIETTQGNQRKVLSPDDEPVAEFALTKGDELIRAYAYCNLHGLWVCEKDCMK